MLLPANFTSVIADHFYDKTVTLPGKTSTTSRGWTDEQPGSATATIKANIRFDKLEESRSELGITESIDLLMTCLPSVSLQKGDFLKYGGITYRAVAVIPFDSHLKIAGAKWQ